MKHHQRTFFILILSFMVVGFFPTISQATNGYFSHGYGTKTKGLGGAGTAYPLDAMAAANNPSGMVFVGDRLDAGMGYFNPNRSYSYTGESPFVATAAQESESTTFLIPHFGYNMMLDTDSSFGATVYGNGGMNTDYANPVYADQTMTADRTGVNLSQLFINFSYAMNLDSVSLGVSAIIAYQQFSAEGLQGFDNALYTSSEGDVTNNGTDSSTGYGLKLGVTSEVGGGITVGAAYQPRIDMSNFDKYKGLFAEQGDFDIPSSYSVGLAWKSGDSLAVVFDYQKINYSEVAAISNPGPADTNIEFFDMGGGMMMPVPASGYKLGEDNGYGFGWEDITVMKLGVEYVLNSDWTLRGGYNKGDNPIPESETFFNILAPGVIEDHVTMGFTYNLSEESELNFSYMKAMEGSVTGDLPQYFGGGSNTIAMDQNELELSYGLKL